MVYAGWHRFSKSLYLQALTERTWRYEIASEYLKTLEVLENLQNPNPAPAAASIEPLSFEVQVQAWHRKFQEHEECTLFHILWVVAISISSIADQGGRTNDNSCPHPQSLTALQRWVLVHTPRATWQVGSEVVLVATFILICCLTSLILQLALPKQTEDLSASLTPTRCTVRLRY